MAINHPGKNGTSHSTCVLGPRRHGFHPVAIAGREYQRSRARGTHTVRDARPKVGSPKIPGGILLGSVLSVVLPFTACPHSKAHGDCAGVVFRRIRWGEAAPGMPGKRNESMMIGGVSGMSRSCCPRHRPPHPKGTAGRTAAGCPGHLWPHPAVRVVVRLHVAMTGTSSLAHARLLRTSRSIVRSG